MPAFLRSEGLRTALISPFTERHSAWHVNAGFSETYNTGNCGMESAEEVTPTVLDWIKRNAKKDITSQMKSKVLNSLLLV